MATRKSKPAPIADKASPKVAGQPRTADRVTAAETSSVMSGRLLREAAWSAMFGRVESKNPFTR